MDVLLITIGVLLVFGIIIFIVQWNNISKSKAYVEELKNNTSDFAFDRFLDESLSCDKIIAVDTTQRKVRIYKYSDKSNVTYNYEDILSVEIIKNGSSVSSRSLSRTVGGTLIGGMLGGVAGAIVGGTTGDQSITSHIYELKVKVTFRSLQNPSEIFSILDYAPESVKDSDYEIEKVFIKKAEDIKDVFSVIIDDVEQKYKASMLDNTIKVAESIKPEPIGSVADELVKLADLKAKGLLTDEEYNTAKKKLLEK